jgi:ring-1,2-phenylacetyl-CoA epoxidase subunit PaaE
MSLIKTLLTEEPRSQALLFYGNKTTASIIFREELEALKNQYLGRLSLHHILSQEGQESALFSGRIDAEKLERFAKIYFDPSEVDDVFICGPEQMMLSLQETLPKLGVSKEKVHVELFTSPVGKLGQTQAVTTKHENYKAEITVIIDGGETTFPYDSDQPILDVAFQHGADLPFSCKGGVCSTCVARITSGEVEMDVNYALEPDEVAAGLVLSCQAFPKSDKVVLNFDV